MKPRYLSISVLVLFLLSAIVAPISATISLAAASSPPAVARPALIKPVLPARAQAGRDLQQAGLLSLIGCPVIPVAGIFASPQAGGQPQDWLIQGTCVEFDQRSQDGLWIRIQSGENLVSHPGWIAAADILLERPADQLPAAGSAESGATPSSAATAGESAAVPGSTGLSACLESVSSLNVRSGPGLAYRSLGYLLKGSCVTLTARTASAAWVKSEKGWIAARYLRVEGDLNQLPVP